MEIQAFYKLFRFNIGVTMFKIEIVQLKNPFISEMPCSCIFFSSVGRLVYDPVYKHISIVPCSSVYRPSKTRAMIVNGNQISIDIPIYKI